MKTKFILLSILSIGLSANSQTINSTNVAVFGDTIYNATDVAPSISIGTPGTGKTWSFSSLLTNSRDTAEFLHPLSMTMGSVFTGATMALRKDTNYVVFKKSTSKLEIIGISNGTTNVISADPETIIPFPSSYNSTFKDTANTILILSRAQAQPLVTITIPAYIDSIRLESTTDVNSKMDASGVLTIPFGTFNAIRQNLTRITTDNIFAKIAGTWNSAPLLVQKDTAMSHQFWSDNSLAKFPIVSYDLNNSGGLSGSVTFMTGYNPTSSIKEVTSKTIGVFPNPAFNSLTFDVTENILKVEIIDITGKVVYVNNVMKYNKINVENLQSGTYFVRILTDKYTGVSKFIKN